MSRALLLAVAALLLPQPAVACIEYNFETDESAILQAEAIFVGKLVDYEVIAPPDNVLGRELAVLTYDVDRALKGEFDDQVRLYWENYAFEYPSSADSFQEIIGVQTGYEAGTPDFRHWLQRPTTLSITTLPRALRPLCGAPITIPASEVNFETIARWIERGEADDTPIDTSISGLTTIEARRTRQIDFTYLILAIVALVVLGSLGAAVNRRHS